MNFDTSKLKWPNGPENFDSASGRVALKAGSQSQRFDLGGIHSVTQFGGWPKPVDSPTFDECTLSYTLEIPDGFEWVKGGKLPGLYGGIVEVQGLSPTCPPDGKNAWSVRPMWSHGGRLWLYIWDMKVPAGGYPLMFQTKNSALSPGNTYKINLLVRMNNPGSANGYVAVSVNGKRVLSKRYCKFRIVPELKIDSFSFSVFYGGSGAEYAPHNDQYLIVRDVSLVIPVNSPSLSLT